jgi:hypothetical protein
VPSRLATVAVASAIGLSAVSVSVVAAPALAATMKGDSPSDAVSGRVAAIRDRLQGLVDDKTLTDAQADKVAETLGEKREGFGPGHGLRGGRGLFGAGLEPAAQVLGMTQGEVRAALREGTTLAELAEREGKSADDVVAALTKAGNERIDRAVGAGRLTQEQATRAKQRLAEGVRRFVQEGAPAKGLGKGFGGGFGPGHGFRDGDRDGGRGGEGTPSPSTPAPGPSASASGSSFGA